MIAVVAEVFPSYKKHQDLRYVRFNQSKTCFHSETTPKIVAICAGQ